MIIYIKKRSLVILALFLLFSYGLQAGVLVELVGNDGKKINVPSKATDFSQKITSLIKKTKENDIYFEIPIEGVEGEVLEGIVKLLGQINNFSSSGKYIPRQLQPIVNKLLKLKDLQGNSDKILFLDYIKKFLYAVEQLGIDFLRNAFAAYYVDKVIDKIFCNKEDIKVSTLSLGGLCQHLQSNFKFISNITINFVKKHLELRSRGISEEFSFADITDYSVVRYNGFYEFKFLCQENKITSLFGVSRVLDWPNKHKTNNKASIILDLNGHCIFGKDFDPQFPESPLEVFGDYLYGLYLFGSSCLDESVFIGLKTLKLLSLDYEAFRNITLIPGLQDLFLSKTENDIPFYRVKEIENSFSETTIHFGKKPSSLASLNLQGVKQ